MENNTVPYQVLSHVQASVGDGPKYLGSGGVCRFCDSTNAKKFRKKAHTFPDALGNKWVFSKDECGDCNAKFSVYEDALAKAVGPLLTLGGTKGKGGVRQTGRSRSGAFIRHRVEDGRRDLSFRAKGEFSDIAMKHNPVTGCIRFDIPVTGDRFVPQLAFKALCKSAVGLLPTDELPHVRDLINWLAEPDSKPSFKNLCVGISFASVGNAPPLVTGTLFRRANDADPVPYLLYAFVAGSVCLQIQVPVDQLDLHVRLMRPNLRRVNKLAKPDGGWEVMSYNDPIHLDWHSAEAILQPIKAFRFDFNLITRHGNFTPVLRENFPLE